MREPGRTVGELAEAEGVSLPRASQELRRLQSRGFLRAERVGAFVRYRPEPDPQVSTARPILEALARAGEEEGIRFVAGGLSHPRRVDIVRELKRGARAEGALQAAVEQPLISMRRHLRELRRRGWVEREGRRWKIAALEHPLAKCLLRAV